MGRYWAHKGQPAKFAAPVEPASIANWSPNAAPRAAGGNSGDIVAFHVIDLTGKAPRIVRAIDVGQYAEGLAFTDDGNYVAIFAQNGSSIAENHPFYNDYSLVVVFNVKGTELTKVAEAKTGKWGQGVAWSRDGKTLARAEHVGACARRAEF